MRLSCSASVHSLSTEPFKNTVRAPQLVRQETNCHYRCFALGVSFYEHIFFTWCMQKFFPLAGGLSSVRRSVASPTEREAGAAWKEQAHGAFKYCRKSNKVLFCTLNYCHLLVLAYHYGLFQVRMQLTLSIFEEKNVGLFLRTFIESLLMINVLRVV